MTSIGRAFTPAGHKPRAGFDELGVAMMFPSAWVQVILYSFPAICWLYGAGFVFSTFVSVVFWGASVQQLWESLRKHSTIVRPMGLQVLHSVATPQSLHALVWSPETACSQDPMRHASN